MRHLLVTLGIVLAATVAYATWGDRPGVLGQLGAVFNATSDIEPYSSYHSYGVAEDVVIGVGRVVWGGPAALDYLGQTPMVADQVEVVSTSADDAFPSGTGAQTLEIFGHDANFDRISEVFELDGLTPKLSVNSYLRVYRSLVRSAGSLELSQGVINVTQVTDPTILFSVVNPGDNQSFDAVYTVPDGMTGFLTAWYGAESGTPPTNTTMALSYGLPGSPMILEEVWGLRSGGTDMYERNYLVPKGPLPEHTDIQVRGATTVPGHELTGGFDLLLFRTE